MWRLFSTTDTFAELAEEWISAVLNSVHCIFPPNIQVQVDLAQILLQGQCIQPKGYAPFNSTQEIEAQILIAFLEDLNEGREGIPECCDPDDDDDGSCHKL